MDLLNFILSILVIISGIYILKYWTKDSILETIGSVVGVYVSGIILILAGSLMFYMEIEKLF